MRKALNLIWDLRWVVLFVVVAIPGILYGIHYLNVADARGQDAREKAATAKLEKDTKVAEEASICKDGTLKFAFVWGYWDTAPHPVLFGSTVSREEFEHLEIHTEKSGGFSVFTGKKKLGDCGTAALTKNKVAKPR